jgi:hypothetical protein
LKTILLAIAEIKTQLADQSRKSAQESLLLRQELRHLSSKVAQGGVGGASFPEEEEIDLPLKSVEELDKLEADLQNKPAIKQALVCQFVCYFTLC